MKTVAFSKFGLLGLCALSLTACSGSTTTTTTTTTTPVEGSINTGPSTPATGPANIASGGYTLQSVTMPSTDFYQKERAVVVCPSKNAAEKIDCTNNAASFDGARYDLGVSIDGPARTGTYANYAEAANPYLNLKLNTNFAGNWSVQGNGATLNITSLKGNYSGGSLRLPIKLVYIKK